MLEKINGLNNYSYLLVNLIEKGNDDIKKYQNKINDINGIIFLDKSKNALYKVKNYNVDLSPCEISGNALVSLILYLYTCGKIKKQEFLVETDAGTKEVNLIVKNNTLKAIRLNMGKPNLNPKLIPVKSEKNIFINEQIKIGDNIFNATCLSIGTPHTVIEKDNVDTLNLNDVGQKLEFYHLFPRRTNIEFTEKISNDLIYIRFWERGNEEVDLCLTGACASVVALSLNDRLKQNKDIDIISNGGHVTVNYRNDDDVIVKVDLNKVKVKKFKH